MIPLRENMIQFVVILVNPKSKGNAPMISRLHSMSLYNLSFVVLNEIGHTLDLFITSVTTLLYLVLVS